MKIHLNLRMFDGGHDITIVKDDGVSSVTVKDSNNQSVSTDVPQNTNCTITVTCVTGGTIYEVKEVVCMTSSVSITRDGTYDNKFHFKMPNSDITIVVRSRVKGKLLYVAPDGGMNNVSPLYVEGKASNSSVAIQRTVKSGYDYMGAEIISGDAQITQDVGNQLIVKIKTTDAVVVLHTRPNNRYMVTEDVVLCKNDKRVFLKTNTELEIGKNGKIIGVEPAGGGTTLTLSDFQPAIDNLIATGVLVKS